MNLRSAAPSSVGKYRALRCSMETLPPDSFTFRNVAGLLNDRSLLRTERNTHNSLQTGFTEP